MDKKTDRRGALAVGADGVPENSCRVPVVAHMINVGGVWCVDAEKSEWADIPTSEIAKILYGAFMRQTQSGTTN